MSRQTKQEAEDQDRAYLNRILQYADRTRFEDGKTPELDPQQEGTQMPSDNEPAKSSERLYPEFSPEEKTAFLEDFKDAVKAGGGEAGTGQHDLSGSSDEVMLLRSGDWDAPV
jgi:hypothetical protein